MRSRSCRTPAWRGTAPAPAPPPPPPPLCRVDEGAEQCYAQISARHKSVRGSDPDAALYWMVRMLDGGADPLYVGRRAVRMAGEDVGLAGPRAARPPLAAL